MTVLAILVLLAGGVWLARRHLVLVTVTGDSMSPTFVHGERLLARRVRDPRAVERGAIVVFRLTPAQLRAQGDHDPVLRIKRVAAIGNDRVPFPLRGQPWAAGGSYVPAGKLVVVGDHPRSQGSRELGYIDAADVLGVVR